MLGTIVNTGTILAGSMIGSIFKKGIKEMARDEARHGKAFEGLLKRYFGE